MVCFPAITQTFERVSGFWNQPIWNTDATVGKLALHCLPVWGLLDIRPFTNISNGVDRLRLQAGGESFRREVRRFGAELAAEQRKLILFHLASFISGIATAVLGFLVAPGLYPVGVAFMSLYHAYASIESTSNYIDYLEKFAFFNQPI